MLPAALQLHFACSACSKNPKKARDFDVPIEQVVGQLDCLKLFVKERRELFVIVLLVHCSALAHSTPDRCLMDDRLTVRCPCDVGRPMDVIRTSDGGHCKSIV